MNSRMTHLAGRRWWRLAALLGAMVLLALFAGAQVVSAQAPVPGVTDVACMNTSPCRAGDIKIAKMTVLNTPACLDDGTGTLYADVLVKAEVVTNSTERYDIGLWIALDGGSANTGPGNQCYHGVLQPLAPPLTFNADGGPFRDLDGDYCGDTQSADGTVYAYIETLRVRCTDTSGTGLMDKVSTCTSWDNNDNTVCSSIAQAVPGTGSKCDCSDTAITPIVLRQIVVRKVTDPNPDPYNASFSFTVSGTGTTPNPADNVFSLKNGEGWDSGQLPAGGTYSVVENAPLPTGWSNTNVVCTDGVNSYDPASITLPDNKSVECTFTNTIQRGKIQVDKVTNPSGAPDSFGMTLTGGPAVPPVNQTFSLTDGSPLYDSGPILPTTPTGTYDISETSVPSGWAFIGGSCNNDSPINAVTVAPGQTVICTLYNAMPTSVNITSFTATGSRTAITLKWTTGNEVDNMGFNVLRASKPRGAKTQINATLIESTYTGLPKGAKYEYRDSTVKKGMTYYYWIEDVDIYGHKTLHGPVKARAK